MQGRVIFLLEEPSMRALLDCWLPRLFPGWVDGQHFQCVPHEGFVAQVEKSRYDPYPRRSYATAGTATVVGHPSCVNRLSKATRTCNSVT